jgi:hypothetical protein
MEVEYKPGDKVPQFSVVYRVVHDPPKKGEYLETFYPDERFPLCPDCGEKVRYVPLRKPRQKEGQKLTHQPN